MTFTTLFLHSLFLALYQNPFHDQHTHTYTFPSFSRLSQFPFRVDVRSARLLFFLPDLAWIRSSIARSLYGLVRYVSFLMVDGHFTLFILLHSSKTDSREEETVRRRRELSFTGS